MSRTLKVTSNHVMYGHSTRFPCQEHSRSWVIMSRVTMAHDFLPLVKNKNMTSIFFHSMYNKTIIRFSFCDSRMIKVSVRVIIWSWRLRVMLTLTETWLFWSQALIFKTYMSDLSVTQIFLCGSQYLIVNCIFSLGCQLSSLFSEVFFYSR